MYISLYSGSDLKNGFDRILINSLIPVKENQILIYLEIYRNFYRKNFLNSLQNRFSNANSMGMVTNLKKIYFNYFNIAQ